MSFSDKNDTLAKEWNALKEEEKEVYNQKAKEQNDNQPKDKKEKGIKNICSFSMYNKIKGRKML